MNDAKTAVYLMPGMAASPLIFDGISLDKAQYDVIKLKWHIPEKLSLIHISEPTRPY